jgi:hypothetical protein
VLVLELVLVMEWCRMGWAVQALAKAPDPALAALWNHTGLLRSYTQRAEQAQCLGLSSC